MPLPSFDCRLERPTGIVRVRPTSAGYAVSVQRYGPKPYSAYMLAVEFTKSRGVAIRRMTALAAKYLD